jgi:hypothetical protein
MCRLSSNLGASASWNPEDLFSPVQGLLYLYLTLKVQLNEKVVGRTKVGKTQRIVGLLCAVLKVKSYNFCTFYLLIKLP